ncbi:MAG TPA: transcriptional regulator [Microbacteriaceae bacterium]|jgi:DNA-binding MarR family transcriptional regulator|nr:transcriptional regulator [Microbacteriaceae bacterium]HQZ48773.1 transcriptional regulator [Microbacteriaceae bacterium]HRA08203.1 transcriptional regulator [Microbacteriaceae bacterium]
MNASFGLNPTIHAPKRLAFMALLAHAQDADFAFVRDTLRVSDSDLSKQATALFEAGYIYITKSGRGRGSTTRFHITKEGRAAYLAHRQALEALLAGADFGEPTGTA